MGGERSEAVRRTVGIGRDIGRGTRLGDRWLWMNINNKRGGGGRDGEEEK